LHDPQVNEKQELIPEEIYQALLTNKKQGNLDLADNIIKSMQTRINSKKYTFCGIKSLEHLKHLKAGRSYLGLELTMHVLKSQIHLVRQSL
jgi:hypothetical protein